jgi:hypothetical protein
LGTLLLQTPAGGNYPNGDELYYYKLQSKQHDENCPTGGQEEEELNEEERKACEREWKEAEDFCRAYWFPVGRPARIPTTGNGRSVYGNNYGQCVKGQVSERCGGNKVE